MLLIRYCRGGSANITAKRTGLLGGLAVFALMLLLPAPAGMSDTAWRCAALTIWMAIWWMTEAVPLTMTALLPFVALPLMGIMSADEAAATYYSPILFLILGGAFIALAIERTGLHRRLALAIVKRSGESARSLLFAFMIATALLSAIVSNTSTTLIMMPIAVAVLMAGGIKPDETEGFAGALPMGIAFAASIGGMGTIVGSPTNAIAVGLINKTLGVQVGFLQWLAFGVPIVLIGVPLAAFVLMRVQRVTADGFDAAAARAAIGDPGAWSTAERRLVPIVVAVVAAWIAIPLLQPLFPKGALTDGTIAIAFAFLLFIVPDGTGRPLLNWREANHAPWGVIMMFGGGLALAAGMTESGLAAWLGEALKPLGGVSPILIALALTALVVLVTEFASNVATASGVMPVVAALIAVTGAEPLMLAMPAAIAASWGFMLPSGTGPNAIAWATGHIALAKMLRAGLWLDILGILLIVGVCTLAAAMM